MKDCSENQIRNPETKRCVKVGGKIYNNLMKKGVEFPSKKSPKKTLGKIVKSPVLDMRLDTNCQGDISKKLVKDLKLCAKSLNIEKYYKLNKQALIDSINEKLNKKGTTPFAPIISESVVKPSKHSKPRKSSTTKPLTMEIHKQLSIVEKQNLRERCENKNWKFDEKNVLGKGGFGNVYIACYDDTLDCEYALKMESIDSTTKNFIFENEIGILKKLNGVNPKITPRILDFWTCEGIGFIVLEKINGISLIDTFGIDISKYYKKAQKLIEILHSIGICQLDAHLGNFMVEKDTDKLYIIDFGLSEDFSKIPKGKREDYYSYRSCVLYDNKMMDISFKYEEWSELPINYKFGNVPPLNSFKGIRMKTSKSDFLEVLNKGIKTNFEWKKFILKKSLEAGLNFNYDWDMIYIEEKIDYSNPTIFFTSPAFMYNGVYNLGTLKYDKNFYKFLFSNNYSRYGVWYVDFANKHLGGGVLGNGFVQEEILFSKFPQTLALVYSEKPVIPKQGAICLTDLNMAINFPNEWYGSDYMNKKFSKRYPNIESIGYSLVKFNFICVDAVDHSRDVKDGKFYTNYSKEEIETLSNKIFSGFLYAAQKYFLENINKGFVYRPNPVEIHTGLWGAGAFKNDPLTMIGIQLKAAAAIPYPIQLYIHGIDDKLKSKVDKMRTEIIENIRAYGYKYYINL